MLLHRSGINVVSQMFVLTIGDGFVFSEFFDLELLLVMASHELRLEVCWDQPYTQDFPTSEGFKCKVTWFRCALDDFFRGSLSGGITRSS